MLRYLAVIPSPGDLARQSLRSKMYVSLGFGCVFAIVAISVITFLYDHHRVNEQSVERAEAVLQTIRKHWSPDPTSSTRSTLLDALVESHTDLVITAISAEGQVIENVGHVADPGFEKSLEFIPEGESLPIRIAVWQDRSTEVQAFGRRAIVVVLVATLVCVAVAFGVGGALLTFVLRPVEKMAVGLRHGGELLAEVPTELKVLQREFNRRRVTWLETLRQLEATNREVSALYTGLSENTLLAILDPKGQIKDVNRRFCEVQGKIKEQILGKDLEDLGWHCSTGRSIHNMKAQWLSSTLVRQEMLRGPESEPTACIDTTFVPCRDEEGQIIKVLMMGVDVTARVNAELDVAWSRAFLHEVVASLDAQLAVIDSVGRIVLTNSAWASAPDPILGGKEAVTLGSNYLTACEAAILDDPAYESRMELAAAIHAALDGSLSRFQIEHLSETAESQRCFVVTLQSIEISGEIFIRMQRQEITEWRSRSFKTDSLRQSSN